MKTLDLEMINYIFISSNVPFPDLPPVRAPTLPSQLVAVTLCFILSSNQYKYVSTQEFVNPDHLLVVDERACWIIFNSPTPRQGYLDQTPNPQEIE